ncbi:sensor histidine kinase [Sphingosinicella terrae]|uniref:sensor histidine kinase n=1 Tax=Sphingosinicella terrae TaxID=2172047 RepID=UPI000E0D846C|nr:HAMP domain-containing sensor histidine kinase [Sphingosinicella terrae]
MKTVARSLYGRLTAAIALVALAATLALALAAELAIRDARDGNLARMVDTDLAGLADIYASGGREELAARIRDRLALSEGGADAPHYLVADASGRPLGGDLDRWPPLSAENSEAGFVATAAGERMFARATQLGPDLRLVVGREYRSWDALAARVRNVLLLSGAVIAALIVAFGNLAASRLQRRVSGINAAYQAVERGEFDRRAPGADRSDELGQLAAHANRMLMRIEAVVRAHRDISDHVAHELRTPLMHLDNRLLRLVERAEGGETSALLASARGDIRHIIRMLDSLLDISASEARRGDTSGLEPVDLSALVTNLAELYADTASDLGIRFDTDIAPDIQLCGDPMHLSRMITNLLDNAFKFGGADGGRIRLSLSSGPRLEVADDGPGIPEDMRERIFERFQRLPAQNGHGHGLGLALARAIAARHGLALRVADAGPGAHFIVEREDQP